jgi:hypothetical protein
MFDSLATYHVHRRNPLPLNNAVAYQYVIAATGVYLRAENRFFDVLAPIARCQIRGLAPLQTHFRLKVPRLPGRRWQLQTAERRFHVPLPPLVFAGAGERYQVFAVKRRPKETPFELFHCPTPNVHPNGDICQGSAPFPACASDTIERALFLFLEGSLFNGDLATNKSRSHPEDVRRLWTRLEEAGRFPVGELMPARTTLDFPL